MSLRVVGHGLHGVGDQVQHHLLQLVAVPPNELEIGVDLGLQSNLPKLQLVADQQYGPLDEVVQVDVH